MTRTVQTFTDAALDAMNAGFSSKAAQKRALDDVTRAYEMLRRQVQNACLASKGGTGPMTDAVTDIYYNCPSYPHAFRAKHAAAVRIEFPELEAVVANLESLAALRNAIVSTVITPPAKDETKAHTARVIESIAALMARRKVQFAMAFDLTDVLGDKCRINGFSCTSHYVTNAHGTQFIRTFYYLFGKLTPLNTILAGAQAKMLEEAA